MTSADIVTTVGTLLRACPVCGLETPQDEVMVQAFVLRRRDKRARWWRRREPVCTGCAAKGHVESPDGLTSVRGVSGWAGVRPVACVACGQLVILRPDKRRKIKACSDPCRLTAYARSVPTVVTKCEGCLARMEGRADRRFCSPACRQWAYRRRAELDRA